ncbi:MAG: tRNA uridine-5-carboxymethylaminomethyl(34) synthesis GTPase MnmE [Synergistaceae bacterium]|nr:tRNA uridine-5-carboxymethylaminomethyl(34) synthesis GTPase MnmE [Synergistaceae bacterium]
MERKETPPPERDIIAAIGTAWGEAGIAIVRISGEGSRELAGKFLSLAVPLEDTPPRFLRNGSLLDDKGDPIDQVLAVWFAPPKSYTGEELVEIHTHGGTLVARKCLDLLLCGGARLAEPGEFTRRAFLSGRIDLTQAEAVLGVIRSRSDEALRAAVRTLRGELAEFARDIYNEILALSGSLEAALDFPEEDLPSGEEDELVLTIQAVEQTLRDLLDRCATGLLLREGIRVAIVGRPNVGKSSLLNALLKESRAIVTAIPGTTRDLIEEVITCRGVPLRLIDTAGMGPPSDEAEAMGISLAEGVFQDADVRIWVVDGSVPLHPDDLKLAERLPGREHVVAVNKSDLPPGAAEGGRTTAEFVADLLPGSTVLSISAKENRGIEMLKDDILAAIAGGGTLEAGLNASARQVEEIRSAAGFLKDAAETLSAGMGQDVAASSLGEARRAMERLLGIEKDDTLLDYIFSQFCLGK